MLIGNGMLIDKVPLTRLGQHWNCFAGDSAMAASTLSDGLGAAAGIPSGYYAPQAFMLPRRAGGMASYCYATAAVGASGAGAMGVTMAGTATLTLSVSDEAGQLIVSGSGVAGLVVGATGNLLAALSGSGAAAFSLSATATPGALAWGNGAASCSLTASLTPYAVGHMNGSTVDAGVLTPSSVAVAVWEYAVRTLTSGGSGGGLSLTQEAQLLETWQRLGLDPAAPMVTGPGSITFGAESIAITEAAGTVTLTRQP